MSLSRYLREYRIVAGGKVPRIDGVDPHPWSAYRHPSLQPIQSPRTIFLRGDVNDGTNDISLVQGSHHYL